MERKRLIEQLKKLATLVERGATEHERDTAKTLFSRVNPELHIGDVSHDHS